ncbi:MAG TPA: dipeptidase [Pyrinomonadaceae bacterium]|nr:dipeptidase [Pyrinomonadaceae bacterium]
MQSSNTVNEHQFPAFWRASNYVAPIILAVTLVIFDANCGGHLNNNQQSSNARSTSERAAADPLSIHRRAIIVDMHADTVQRVIDENVDINQRLSDGHLDAARAKEGGLDAQFFSIWVEPQLFGGGGASAMKRADIQIEAIHDLAIKHPETWEMATTADDVRRASADGKIAALMGLEGGYAIDEKIENVQRYYNLGVRYMSPAWSVSTSWAGSSGDAVGETRGLNDFGKQVVREMNRLGMIVDVSHVSDKTFWDIVNTSTKPVVATHSGCRAIANVPRNLTDDMIKALAKTGGVVNVIFYPEHIEPGWSEKKKKVDNDIASLVERASAEEQGTVAQKKLARDRVRSREYLQRLPPVSVARIVDHIDHIVKLVGIDHVGIGSDFDGVQAVPADLKSVADLPNLTRELLKRGYSESDVDKILGGNMLRVMEEVARK